MSDAIHPTEIHQDQILSDFRDGKSISQISQRIDCNEHHILCVLRNKGLMNHTLTKEDFAFISEYIHFLPRSVIAHCLGLPKPVIWKLQKKHGLLDDSNENITSLSQATEIFKFLVESDYCFGEDFFLTTLHTHSILKGPYYELYKFGLKYIAEFNLHSVLGILCENAYPEKYRSFQFNAKNNVSKFKSIEDLNEGLLWSFEKLTGSSLVTLANKNEKIALMNLNEPMVGFGADDLRKHYIARREWNRYYPDFASLKRGLASYIGIREAKTKRRASTSELRKRYDLSTSCEVCSYSDHVEIHHIYPVEDTRKLIPDREINSRENLIVLCPNHHRQAAKFDWHSSLINKVKDRKSALVQFLEQ